MEGQIGVTMRPIITLLTDFGTADGYVAEMKGVLFSSIPEATVVDLSHDVPPQDIECARLTVARYWRRFPAGTVHLVVVDPGVGSSRAPLAVNSDGRFLVGPDNGGALLAEPVVRRTPEARRAADGSVIGEVIAIDRFGNAVTNLIAPRGGRVEIAGRTMPIVRTYADVSSGEMVALVGSIGFVEVAQRDGRAADALGVVRGMPVTLRAPRA
jgi:S-adenosylmethionine hydrolase